LFILLFPLFGPIAGLHIQGDGTQTQINETSNEGSLSLQSIAPPTMPISSRGLKVTGPVAILEDVDPWGYNDVETILNTYSHMRVDTIPSASFGTISLSQYQKVIIIVVIVLIYLFMKRRGPSK
jgi:hypothetical protein